MRRLQDQEGYLVVDHRNSPGVSDEMAAAVGMPVGAGRGVFETPTFTCSHCQRAVIMRPDRTRGRNYCRKCDHLICDGCANAMHQTGVHKTFEEVIGDYLESAEKKSGPAPQLILPT